MTRYPTPPSRYRKIFFLLPLGLLLLSGCTPGLVREQPSPPSPLAGKPPPAPVVDIRPRPLDTVIWDRLRKNFAFEIKDNRRIAIERKRLLKYPKQLRQVQRNARLYLRLVIDEIEERQLPGELALIPVIESSYRAEANSPGGTAGLWQFTAATGRLFGLENNWWYDGRRDVVSSTQGALDYFHRLNRRYNKDWELTLAAYNAGDGTIDRAIRKNRKLGKSTNYWDLELPRATKHYIPRLYALAQIFSDPAAYGLTLDPIPEKHLVYVADTGAQIDMGLAAKLAGVNHADLKHLNPAYSHWATNPKGPHRLLLPASKSEIFRLRLSAVPKDKWMQIRQHQVLKGETLAGIARTHGVAVDLIKQANGIKGHADTRPGQTLAVPTPYTEKESYLIALNAMEMTLPTAAGIPAGDKKPTLAAIKPEQVRKDPVRAIAKRFQGLFSRRL
ncbi:MAG: transglycosylase SLT domain-containing protein [Gammaproteobacteria bacterium]|nr:transglycosylase SLT domain-containing protein [Gammaproteobacteria bacterium]MBU1655658.1 transglycosylase SLT domain-containing protein [Gammaproteobacteria bacterium]MBU1960311.1 transglycosylase SLT domain-containing protein [Gammaproteobacteria bacterium]